MPRGRNPHMVGFLKVIVYLTCTRHINFVCYFSDLLLALTCAVDESVPDRFYQRPSSFTKSRSILLVLWLMMATILSHAFKGALLSSLTTIRYTKPLDTIDEMVDSGLPFYVPHGTIHKWLLKTHPTEGAMQLYKRRLFIPFSGDFKEKDMKMYKYNSVKLQIPAS